MSTPILSIENVSKTFRSNWTYRPVEALRNISLQVFPGESFGFLGHNGAGKTTAMKLIVGLIQSNQGRILIDGAELQNPEQRKTIGYLPELPYFYDHLTVGETLEFFASLHGLNRAQQKSRVAELLRLVNLEERRHNNMRSLSKGLQQRVGIAQAIINHPRLLLLDEPFSGLDPLGRKEIRELILNLRKQGTTIFLSSHILSDVEDICDRVSIMSRGELKKVFALAELPSLLTEGFELVVNSSSAETTTNLVDLAALTKLASQQVVHKLAGNSLIVLKFESQEAAQQALQKALTLGVKVERYGAISARLEDVFVQVTGGSQ